MNSPRFKVFGGPLSVKDFFKMESILFNVESSGGGALR